MFTNGYDCRMRCLLGCPEAWTRAHDCHIGEDVQLYNLDVLALVRVENDTCHDVRQGILVLNSVLAPMVCETIQPGDEGM